MSHAQPVSSSSFFGFLVSVSRRAFSSGDGASGVRRLKNVPSRHRAAALCHARSVLTEYLHVTRSLQFCHAENIAANSPLASPRSSPGSASPMIPLSSPARSAVSSPFVRSTSSTSSSRVSASLRCDPPAPAAMAEASSSPRTRGSSPPSPLWSGSASLDEAGDPLPRLGDLLISYENLGFDKVAVIGICLAFPSVLAVDGISSGREIPALFEDLKRVISDFHTEGSAEENVEAYFRLCRRIRVFYNLGCEKGAMGSSLRRAGICGFLLPAGDERDEVGLFVLRRPEVLQLDLENPSLRMPDYLKQIGLCEEELNSVFLKYPYAMGKNRLGNLPGVLRAVDLSEFFVRKIRNGGHRYLSPDSDLRISDDEVAEDNDFQHELAKTRRVTKSNLVTNKLEFLLGIGFGENKITLKSLRQLNSTKAQLKERFDCLLEMGLEYSMICRMVSATPKLLNQNADMLRVKIDHLRNNLGCSLEYLNNFPAYLCFNLENRVKPRYRILNWLKEVGLLKKTYSPATILATSEKKFIGCLLEIHPAAPKQWFEVFSRNHSKEHLRNYDSDG
ncbi:unnamed protein product [Spirodela intermedia]|uniref:Uncharacterized protein n=1 Tax=Spirodela intermedia TaxID=51605 RepID=A0A7I8IF44_SPIIN|nr:unnamed protein product [Spirodela intermedia]CAA6656417.1 unnamed protein product [Spirodela intermedia]